MFSICPLDGDDGVGESTDDCFEGHFNGDVEMMGYDGSDTFYSFFPVGLECICCVVQWDLKEDTDEAVGDTVYDEFPFGVVMGFSTFGKSGSEDAVVSFLKFSVVADCIFRVIAPIGHHNGDGVSACVF